MEHVRELSKTLFGAQYRLEIIALLDAGKTFSLTELAKDLSNPPSISSVQKELKCLLAAGLLVAEPTMTSMRERFYTAAPSELWSAVRSMYELTMTEVQSEARND